LGVTKWLKYLGCVCVCVKTGLFSSLPSIVNDDYRILTWKRCARKLSWPIFAWQDCKNHEKLKAGVK